MFSWAWPSSERRVKKINCCKHKQKYNFCCLASTWATYLWHASTYAIYCNPIAERGAKGDCFYLFGKLRLYRTQTELRGIPRRSQRKESRDRNRNRNRRHVECVAVGGGRWAVDGGWWHHKSLAGTPGPGPRTQDSFVGPMYFAVFVMLVKHFARDRLTIFRF